MNSDIILSTARMYLRPLRESDYDDLCKMLKDKKCMYAYEETFGEEECRGWLKRHIARYETFGFGHWAVINKETGEFLGQSGLIIQDVQGIKELEVGYLFLRKHWGRGYAAEITKAIRDYVFNDMKKDRLSAIIRDNNPSSIKVAEKLGMKKEKEYEKEYFGKKLTYYLYAINKEDFKE